jgi:hypothetical protein
MLENRSAATRGPSKVTDCLLVQLRTSGDIEATNQLTNQPTNQPTSQQTSQPTNQPANYQPTNQPTTGKLSDMNAIELEWWSGLPSRTHT